MKADDPYGDWLMAFLLEGGGSDREPPPPTPVAPALWWIWVRMFAGVAVMSFAVGASVCVFASTIGGMLTGWIVATAAGVHLTTQTLDQTE